MNPSGEVKQRYFKMHRVMFGEYIPLGDWLPWIYSLTPMSSGLTAGERPETFVVNQVTFAPNICFESTVPHLIRGQLKELTNQDRRPDVMVNVTNDGWFWGSSILDLHFACGVFRAVENGRPHLIAANPGISGWVDAKGRLLHKSPRRERDVIIAEVESSNIQTLYGRVGDVLAWMCVSACLLALGIEIIEIRRNSQATSGD